VGALNDGGAGYYRALYRGSARRRKDLNPVERVGIVATQPR